MEWVLNQLLGERLRRVGLNLIFILGIFSAELNAKTLELNLNNGLAEDVYLERLAQVGIKDILQFSDGESYRVLDFSTRMGNSARIFRVERISEERRTGALRIPNSSNNTDLLWAAINAYPLLVRNGVKVPALLHFSKGEYMFQEWINNDFSLRELLADRSLEYRSQALLALREFAQSTATMTHIGDFGPDQLVYSRVSRQWVLLDWTGARDLTNPHSQFRDVFEGSFSASLGSEATKIIQDLRDLIKQERRLRGLEVQVSERQSRVERVVSDFIANRQERFENSGDRRGGCGDLFRRTRDF